MPHRPWYQRPSRTIPLAILAFGTAIAITAVVSPWPTALTIRALFEKGAADTVAEMLPYAPTEGVDERLNLAYAKNNKDTKFDVFSPSDSTGPLPTVVWIHGGAWISGAKENVNPYARMLAAQGFTTVTLDYTISPETIYPTALTQLNTALGYLVDNAEDLRIDPTQIIIAGDSAGAQYTSQLAALVTNPEYAELVGIAPTLTKDQLTAVILNCGIYDVSGIPDAPGIGGWGFRMALWSYMGDRNWANSPGGQEMSTLDYVTADFPQTWISGGNGDPLTPSQSKPFAKKLSSLGVPVTSVFYPKDHEPALPHEYQFHLDFEDARNAFDSTVEFLTSVTTG